VTKNLETAAKIIENTVVGPSSSVARAMAALGDEKRSLRSVKEVALGEGTLLVLEFADGATVIMLDTKGKATPIWTSLAKPTEKTGDASAKSGTPPNDLGFGHKITANPVKQPAVSEEIELLKLEFELAEVTLAQALKAQQRLEKLRDSKVVSQEEVDAGEFEVKKAEIEVRKCKLRISRAAQTGDPGR
jgi:hypothetical protein